jgi:glycosyltransferase involved in cell wall biosynthesis
VLTVSNAARADVGRTLGVPDRRLRTVGEAPDPAFVPMAADRRHQLLARFGLGPGARYVLYAGGISPHKNLGVLVAAFGDVAAGRPDVRLVVAGDLDDDPFLSSAGSLRSAVAASPFRDRITLAGFVTDDELAALYGGAVATVQPSMGEGFGLTAAESAACGTPVVASDLPALTELLGDVALYAPPDRPDAFATALGRLLDDPAERLRLSHASLERARRWSWSAAADTVIGVLEEAARSRA